MKIKIKHVDGVTDVMAKVIFGHKDINLEYKFEGMTWGRTIDLSEAVTLGIVLENEYTKQQEEAARNFGGH